MRLYKSYGTLRYSILENGEYKLVADVDSGIVDLARALVPRTVTLNRQRYSPHISIVRKEIVASSNWGLYDGKEYEFSYDPIVRNDEMYYWLDVYCPFFNDVRIGLGLLPTSEKSRPPDGKDCFHVTIGNTKTLT